MNLSISSSRGQTVLWWWGLGLMSIVVFILGLYVSSSLFPTSRMQAVAALDESTEVLVAGSSRVECGVNPNLLQRRVVNISCGGLSYTAMTPVLCKAIKRAPNLKAILIEADIFMLRQDGPFSQQLWELGLPPWEWPCPVWHRIRYLLTHPPFLIGGRLTPEAVHSLLSSQTNGVNKANHGFVPFPYLRSVEHDVKNEYGAAKFLQVHKEFQKHQELAAPNMEALLTFINDARSKHIKVGLLTLPHLQEWNQGVPADWKRDCDTLIRVVRDIDPGALVYMDYRYDSRFSPSKFNDGLHLNTTGMQLFCEDLNTQIEQWLAGADLRCASESRQGIQGF